ncbi:MAG: GWxTD domain-containing protein [Roseivirga sp.]|jgi:GWxTD domain-containing protein
MKRLIIFSLFLFSSFGLFSQSRMSSADISYLYNQNHEFLVDYRLAQNENQVQVYVRFILNSGIVKISDYELTFDVRSSYIDERHVAATKRLDSSSVVGTGFREFVYAFGFERKSDQNLIVLEINNIARGKNFVMDIPISAKEGVSNQPFLIFEEKRDVPYFSKFINLDQTVRLVNVFGNKGKYEIKGVLNNKSVALPPFDNSEPNTTSKIEIDTLYGAIEAESFSFSTPGFYEINEFSDPNNKLGILVTDAFYPYFNRYDNMIQPLIFITTTDEFKDMRKADNVRDAFEDFVMNRFSGSSKMSQEFVKYYYKRIRDAAHLFTTNKEGWKTDRGMVYQIYGNPIQVFRNENTELWVFTSPNGNRTRFIFDVISGEANLLEFSLIRGNKYKESWMDAVTGWRSGKIIE